MKTLRHPHIEPALLIEVPDDRVPAHVAAGWLDELAEPNPDHDPGEKPDNPEES